MRWNGLIHAMADFLCESWHPPWGKDELAYSTHLTEFIREHTHAQVVKHQYPHRGQKVDVYASWRGLLSTSELYIEVKLNLRRKGDYDRLVGQIEGFGPTHDDPLIVMLVGDTDESYFEQLSTRYYDARFCNEVRIVRATIASDDAPD